jgi:hypothetical protein
MPNNGMPRSLAEAT